MAKKAKAKQPPDKKVPAGVVCEQCGSTRLDRVAEFNRCLDCEHDQRA